MLFPDYVARASVAKICNMRVVLALLALVASAAAFAPSAAGRVSVAVGAGYVPDGLTAAEWAKKQKSETAAKAANKKKVATQWGVGRTGQEKSLTDFQKKRDAKFPNTPGAGHMWCKAKYYSWKDGRTGEDAVVRQSRVDREGDPRAVRGRK